MLNLFRCDSENPDFLHLVTLLDQDLAIRDGDEHAFYAQFNKVDKIKHCVVAFWENQAVGCGAIRALDDILKRMAGHQAKKNPLLRALRAWGTEGVG